MVSIVIPVFNKLELTRACLASLRAHTEPGACEIIVVDNGSTDGSTEWLREREQAGELRLLAPGENLGFARGCNLGAQASVGRYLLFLNNDTEVTPGWLEPLVDTLDRDATVGAVGVEAALRGRHHPARGRGDHRPRAAGLERPAHRLEAAGRRPRAAIDPRFCQALTAACLLRPAPAPSRRPAASTTSTGTATRTSTSASSSARPAGGWCTSRRASSSTTNRSRAPSAGARCSTTWSG